MYLWDPIVDDDSSDYIAAVALKLATYESDIRPVPLEHNRGKGGRRPVRIQAIVARRGPHALPAPAPRDTDIQRRVLAAHQVVVYPRRRAACHNGMRSQGAGSTSCATRR